MSFLPPFVSNFSNFDSIKALVDMGADVDIKCFGTPLLHLILGIGALPEGLEFGMKAFGFLLGYVDIDAKVRY